MGSRVCVEPIFDIDRQRKNGMENKKSVFKTEINMSGIFTKIPENLYSILAAVGGGLLIVAPAVMAVLAMIKRDIDFTVLVYPVIIKNIVFPISSVLFFAAVLLYIFRLIYQKKRFVEIIKENPVIVIFAVTAFWMIISQIVNGFGYAFFGYHVAAREETYVMQLCYMLILLPGAALIKNGKYKLYLVRTHICVSILLVIAAFVLWKTQETSTFFSDWTPRFSSIFTNTNYYGYYLAISIPLCAASFVSEQKLPFKILGIAGLIINTVALSYDNTMGAWVACTAAMILMFIIYTIVRRRVSVLSIIVTVIFIFCLILTGYLNGNFEANTAELLGDVVKVIEQSEDVNGAGSGRWAIWKKCIELILKSPVFGIGFEGISFRTLLDTVGNYRPHNEFLQYALFYGIPASVLYFCGCGGVFLRGLKKRATVEYPTLICLLGAFGYLVSSVFGLSLYCTTPFLFVFLGMGYADGNVPEQKSVVLN